MINMGTVVGNVCAAVPYYDLPTVLAALHAQVRVVGKQGQRTVALDEFYPAAGMTSLGRDELVSAIFVPAPPPNAASAFARILKARRSTSDLHKVSAAAHLRLDDERKAVSQITIVLGSVSFKPVRSTSAERRLVGRLPDHANLEAAAEEAASALEPLTSLTWLEEARRQFVRALVYDTLVQARDRALAAHSEDRMGRSRVASAR
jgi:carbon-monoxide dehydrogenase medium subunit